MSMEINIVKHRHDAEIGINCEVIKVHIDAHMNPYKPKDKEN